MLTIGGFDFLVSELNSATWIDRGMYCDTFLSDINGDCHTIKNWYDDDSYTIISSNISVNCVEI